MAYGTNKGYIKKQAAKVNKKTKAKSDSSLYYKDKSGTVRFKSNNKEVASGRASTPMFDPIDVVGFVGSVAKNSAKLAGKVASPGIKKLANVSSIINKAYAKTVAPLIASTLSGGDNNKPAKKTQTIKKSTKKSKSK